MGICHVYCFHIGVLRTSTGLSGQEAVTVHRGRPMLFRCQTESHATGVDFIVIKVCVSSLVHKFLIHCDKKAYVECVPDLRIQWGLNSLAIDVTSTYCT
jgi:hypothetical protein